MATSSKIAEINVPIAVPVIAQNINKHYANKYAENAGFNPIM